MKLIEKLALEAADQDGDPCEEGAFMAGYQEGFRKAREMAAELAARQEDNTPYKITKLGEDETN